MSFRLCAVWREHDCYAVNVLVYCTQFTGEKGSQPLTTSQKDNKKSSNELECYAFGIIEFTSFAMG